MPTTSVDHNPEQAAKIFTDPSKVPDLMSKDQCQTAAKFVAGTVNNTKEAIAKSVTANFKKLIEQQTAI